MRQILSHHEYASIESADLRTYNLFGTIRAIDFEDRQVAKKQHPVVVTATTVRVAAHHPRHRSTGGEVDDDNDYDDDLSPEADHSDHFPIITSA
jgi:hypothetical protein